MTCSSSIESENIYSSEATLLLIEPFFSGSHEQLIKTILSDQTLVHSDCYELYTLPGKKWHWRARTCALYLSQIIKQNHKYKVLFCSSTLNLCELVGLRPDLRPLHKVIYFHENQIVYPVRKTQERDFQYGYNQVLSCLVADCILFNSHYNLESFVGGLSKFFKVQPDFHPNISSIIEYIRSHASVVYFPISIPAGMKMIEKSGLLHIIWPHRWEHDKDPDTFFATLFKLADEGVMFRVSVLGEMFNKNPDIFAVAHEKLKDYICQWGFLCNKNEYYNVLQSGDIVVSTALHEFFGVAMLEAVMLGCVPLCPNRLVYPEIFSEEYLYHTPEDLEEKLKKLCSEPASLRSKKFSFDIDQFLWKNLRNDFLKSLNF